MSVKKIFIWFLTWRLLLFLPPLFAASLYLSYRPDAPYTNMWYFIKPYFPVENPLFYPWANFDGVHYLNIAGHGYTTNARFFPLYPLLILLVSFLFGKGIPYGALQFFTAFFISQLFFFLSLVAFNKLLAFDYKKNIVERTILFLLLFPTSFFFAAIYTESLFLFLTILSLYFARRRKWLFASLCGMLLTATRVVGIAILPALMYELWTTEKNKKVVLKKSFSLFLVPLGIIIYAIYNFFIWNNPLHFWVSQGTLGNSRSVFGVVLPPQTVIRYMKILTTLPLIQFEWWIALLEAVVFALCCLLLFIAWKKKVRASYLVFAALAFLIPTLSGTFSGLPRYAIVLFPIFIALALTKNKYITIIYAIIAPLLLFMLLMFFSRGYFVA